MKNGHVIAPVELVQYMKNKSNPSGSASNDIVIPLLLDKWTLDGTTGNYIQTVNVEGLTEDANPIIVLGSADTVATEDELNAFNCLVNEVEVTNGAIKFVAKTKPSISFNVIAKGAVGADNSTIVSLSSSRLPMCALCSLPWTPTPSW